MKFISLLWPIAGTILLGLLWIKSDPDSGNDERIQGLIVIIIILLFFIWIPWLFGFLFGIL